MHVVKFFIGLFPAEIRKGMRKNIWLFNLYSQSLQKSGLFYGFPSPQKLQKLYIKIVKEQTSEIAKTVKSFSDDIEVNGLLVLTGKYKYDRDAIEFMLKLRSVNNIYVTGSEKLVKHHLKELSDLSINNVFNLNALTGNELSKPLLVLSGGDVAHPQAVTFMLSHVGQPVKNCILYCDMDYLDEANNPHLAEFYPGWNPDLQLATGYVKTGVILIGEKVIGNFCEFSQEYDSNAILSIWLVNAFLENLQIPITHVPFSLVHRSLKTQYLWEKELRHLNRKEYISYKQGEGDVASIKWDASITPLVSLIIPTKNAKQLVQNCIESIISKTTYSNYEILLIDNNSDDLESLRYFEQISQIESKVRVLKYSFDFNYSAINNFAVEHANGDVIGLINNDIEVISPTWLGDMVGHVLRSDIGCVGAKLYYPDERVQHAGVVMGYGGGAGHAHKYFPRYHPGYLNRLAATNNFSAVTAACLLVSKRDYLAVGGLDEINLMVAFNDVDFCLKVLELGRRNLYCAEAELFHHESVSRGADDTKEKRERFEKELHYIQTKWASYIDEDPAYNPNLTLRRENFSIKE